jgi:hypothetical protein
MELIHSLDRWHKTRLGFLILGLAELGIFYGFFCLSLTLGNFLLYIITAIFLVGGVKNLARFIRSYFHGK